MTVTWVDLAPLVDPIRSWLQTGVGKTVTYGRAPKGGVPPFVVVQLVGDPRPILTLDGGVPAEVTWQCDCLGESPLQALALADKVSRAMVLASPPDLAAAHAYVTAREAVGDTRADKISDTRFVLQARYRWTLVGTT